MPRPRHGFTLVELLVALVVGSLVLSAAYRAVGIAVDATARMRAEQRAASRGGAARAQLEAWIRSATSLDGAEPFLGTRHAPADGPPRDELSFAVADGGTLWPGPHRIRLFVGPEPASGGSALVAELRPLDGRPSTRPETVAVASGALGLGLRYRARFRTGASWAGEWSAFGRLPEAVELRLVPGVGRGDAALAPILALPLVVPLAWSEEP